jgi:transcriptional regulator with XRE-family HTH domain
MSVATLLARLRAQRGYSQAELARRSGIPRTAVNAYERGHRSPTAATLARLAEACGYTLDVTPRQGTDEQASARALEQALDLAELLPVRRRKTLTFPPLPGRRR